MRKILNIGLNISSLIILNILSIQLIIQMAVIGFATFIIMFIRMFLSARGTFSYDYLFRAYFMTNFNLVVVVNFMLFMLALKLIRNKIISWENIAIIFVGLGAIYAFYTRNASLHNFFAFKLPIVIQSAAGIIFFCYFLTCKRERASFGWFLLSLFFVFVGSCICIIAYIIKKGFPYSMLGLPFDDDA